MEERYREKQAEASKVCPSLNSFPSFSPCVKMKKLNVPFLDCKSPFIESGWVSTFSSANWSSSAKLSVGRVIERRLIDSLAKIFSRVPLTIKEMLELLSGRAESREDDGEPSEKKGKVKGKEKVDYGSDVLQCSFCIKLPERPVTV